MGTGGGKAMARKVCGVNKTEYPPFKKIDLEHIVLLNGTRVFKDLVTGLAL